MSDEIPVDEYEPRAEKSGEWTEEMSVAGSRLVKTVQELLREAVVRKIVIQDKDGKQLLEIPLYAGVLGVAVLGYWSVLALIAAWFTEVSILIVREKMPEDVVDAEPAVSVGDMAEKAGTAMGDIAYRASKAASDLARRAADAVEGAATAATTPTNGTADVTKKATAEAKATPVEAEKEPQRCQATTKAGTQCKRNALEGSDYCSTHQPA